MATLNVPGTYPTISQAVAAAIAGDTILIASGYAGNETVSVTINNLTFSAPSSVPGIVLNAAPGILIIKLADASPIAVNGNTGNNTINGNAGANVITDGGGGNDTLNGGNGNDTLTVTGGTDTVNGGNNDDLLIVDYSTATAAVSGSASGGSGSFTDGGTRAVNFSLVERLQVLGGSGNDTLTGGGGNDTINGGDGADTIDGGGGTDTLSGAAGNDSFLIYANYAGTVDGGADTDTVNASGDLGTVAFSTVEVLDQQGYGYVYATAAQLNSFGSIVSTGTAADSQYGFYLRGPGGTIDFSTKVAGAHSVYVADGGLSAAVTVTGTANNDTLDFGGSTYANTLNGGGGNDTINGGNGGGTLNGGAGNDTLNGGAGNDTIDGGADNDAIYGGGSGNDTLTGGTGNDTFLLPGSAAGTVDGGADTDTVNASGDLGTVAFSTVEVLDQQGYGYVYATAAQLNSFGSIISTGTAANSQYSVYLRGLGGAIDFSTRVTGAHSVYVADGGLTAAVTVTGTGNNDTLTFGGSTYANTLNGGAGNDTLTGGAGADTIDGGADNDTIYGGGGGGDTLTGGAGNDTFIGGNYTGTVDGGADTDTVNAGANLGTEAFSNVEVLDLEGYGYTYATAGQLSSFGSIISTSAPANSQYGIYLLGAGGSIDFSTRVAGQHSVSVSDQGLTAAVTVTGSVNNDTLYFGNSTYANTLNGGGGNDTLTGGSVADTIDGGSGIDTIDGGGGTDNLTGGIGNDIFLISSVSAGTVDGGADTDTVKAFADLGAVTFSAVEVLDLQGYSYTYADIAQLNSFGSIVSTGTAANSQYGFYLRGPGGTIDFSGKVTGGHSVSINDGGLTAGVTITGTTNNDTLNGSAYGDSLDGGAGNDTLYAGAGVDLLHGGIGNDTLYGDYDGSDTATYYDAGGSVRVNLNTTTGQNTINAGTDTLQGIWNLIGSGFDDTFTGNGNDNILDGGVGNDTVIGGTGNDTLIGGIGNDTLTGGGDTDTASYASAASGVTVDLSITVAQNTGGAGTDTITQVENLIGSAYDDILGSNISANRLDGGSGGIDTASYSKSTVGVTVNLLTNVNTGGDAAGDSLFSIENVTGSAQVDTITGDTNANVLRGLAGADTLNGGDGNDTLEGGDGNDTLNGGDGIDTASYASATAAVTIDLSIVGTPQSVSGAGADRISNVENLLGSDQGDTLTGNGGANTIDGGLGADTLNGGAGADTLIGGGGSDTVVVGASWQQTTIAQNMDGSFSLTVGGETDTVSGVESFQFTNGTFAAADILNDAPVGNDDGDASLVESGVGTAGTASASGNLLTNDADPDLPLGDVLAVSGIRTGTEGAGGSLSAVSGSTAIAGTYGTLTIGANGAWSYALDNADPDTQALAAGASASETFTYQVTDSKGLSDLAQLVLTITGSNDAPVPAPLTGSTNEDTPYSGSVAAGDPDNANLTYALVGPAPDGVVFNADGTFTVTPIAADQALGPGDVRDVTFSYTASDGLVVSDPQTVTISITGLNDAPTVSGEQGYVTRGSTLAIAASILLANDSDIEGDGISLVSVGNASNGTVSLASGTVTFTATSSAVPATAGFDYGVSDGTDTGTGHVTLNLVTTSAAANTVTVATAANEFSYIDGLGGSDTLTGGEGRDTLVGSAGLDKLFGQGGNDTLLGGADADTLNGGTGDDAMFGGAGNDTYVVDSASDTVREDTSAGVDDGGADSVQSAISFTLGSFVENLTLTGSDPINGTGNALANTINGNGGNNVLDGGSLGADKLNGGAGNDTYIVSHAGVIITEALGGGVDTVQSAVNFTLAANVDNLILTGSGGNATGNTLDNLLTGNSGMNVLDGKGGADTMTGGGGNDTYYVDVVGDIVVEGVGGGTDTVRASINYVLGDNLENLLINSTATRNGTGNGVNNIITGGDGANSFRDSADATR